MNRPRSPYRAGTSSIWQWIGGAPGHTEKPSPQALADRARRRALGERQDLTGRMLGDPPPGRSALDRKLEAERRRLEQSRIEDLAGGDTEEKDEA
jgi:hypothetical protein